jgi:hypothetical protein
VASHALAQNPIPNPGFETWSSGNPVGWYTSNDGLPGSVTQTADRHAGSWAVRGDVVEIFPGFNGQPMIMTGEMSEGFLTDTQWGSLEGFYKFNSVTGDQLLFSVSFTSADSGTVGGGSMFLPATGSTYQPFTVPIFWSGPGLPDTGYIFAFIYGPSGTPPHLGSYFQFDDFSLGEGTPPVCQVSMTGDVNENGARNNADIIYLVNTVLKAGANPLPCRGAGDVNCDGQLNTSDIIYLVNSVLKGGPAPCDVCTIIPGSWQCP